jgi:hypothetical protein
MLNNLSMATPILATKLYLLPPPSKVAIRTRLVEQFTTAGGSRVAPPGLAAVFYCRDLCRICLHARKIRMSLDVTDASRPLISGVFSWTA